jgi:GntR family transcriptional regulator/MocR family aminotransferase
MEQPGYAQMRKVIELQRLHYMPAPVNAHTGLDISMILASNARALYLTPSNQYPMGTTINTDERLKLINWAATGQRWIIEDDYDSEFQFAHRPYTSLQGLAGQIGQDQWVMYIGSFSKVMFNGLRLGYLVVPDSLVSRCLEIKDALTGDLPAHTQAALADFINDGDLNRHIRKMRRLYKAKYQQMISAIDCYFGSRIEVISQPAGLHVTLKWHGGIDEMLWTERARQSGIVIRPLSYYEQQNPSQRNWNGAVLGFGNIALDEIDGKVQEIAQLFFT